MIENGRLTSVSRQKYFVLVKTIYIQNAFHLSELHRLDCTKCKFYANYIIESYCHWSGDKNKKSIGFQRFRTLRSRYG
ncbi:unnamed protein product [Rhizophagus irregularis]|nr:unnamed protein product [Rhizophagus irregularis]